MTPSMPSAADSHVVLVFISSTFRDMFREREILVKHIFRQLGGRLGPVANSARPFDTSRPLTYNPAMLEPCRL
jgi:hypothetical protein